MTNREYLDIINEYQKNPESFLNDEKKMEKLNAVLNKSKKLLQKELSKKKN